MAQSASWVNEGFIIRPGATVPAKADAGRTFIISGLGRGGTTMIASVLRTAGIPLGDRLFEAAMEDLDMAHVLHANDPVMLGEIIAQRNARFRDWGFKIPYIHGLLRYADIARFRNPHLILVFRDPVAVTGRIKLSDYKDPLEALPSIATSVVNLIEYVRHTECPCLLLSYEKAVIFPEVFVDTLTAFCGLKLKSQARAQVLRQVMPNSIEYAAGTTVKIAGRLETLRGTQLFGWCAYVNIMDTVELDLFVNATKVRTFKAEQFRPDLLAAGFHNGNHGFTVDLGGVALTPSDRLHVRIKARELYELDNSGRTVAEYQHLV